MTKPPRPTVSPNVVAAIIDATPDRVRRRLDRNPQAAKEWRWQWAQTTWQVEAGNETVVFSGTHLETIDQMVCSCLLAPHCFHIAACLTSLDVVLPDAVSAESAESFEEQGEVVETELSPGQRQAASEFVRALTRILEAGVTNTGVLLQSQLLRSVHQCRAEGLHRAAVTGLRIMSGTLEFRKRSPESDPLQLALDIADALETTRRLLDEKSVAPYWVGTSRRAQFPVEPGKLQGLLAEPVLTRSGFAGATVLFLGGDSRFYSVGEVRPGDEQLARDAYRGGVEMGSLIQPAHKLARSLYVGTGLTASLQGRLGRGKKVKIIEQGTASWQSRDVQALFQRPVLDQWNGVFQRAVLPEVEQPAGWDLVFLTGSVQGAYGSALLFQLTENGAVLELAIENEHPALFYRENLRMLSHAPGLRLQIIARIRLQEPDRIFPLAVTQDINPAPAVQEPRLGLSEKLQGCLLLGFDELQRSHLVNAEIHEFIFDRHPQAEESDVLSRLQRRWVALMIGGATAQRKTTQSTSGDEISLLQRNGYETAAALLDQFSRVASVEGPSIVHVFLATAVYLKHAQYELIRSAALERLASVD
ncbi:hypothetical protein [Gimesia maris]|uniref:SWIM-type domain-containing protein n=1 Tax=Gimesia maris TaxID=122 RepID=A0ABX5YNL6_9PLAN|nr:hypothetical protein [Gimesia maris]EDL62255.1 hypothetical protein PM8797T_28044 [Gimesia maris DSM 8797]QEG17341.1 hypothetical protein GmarT_32210 [Gimesia maris]QGQ29568.1 hypothetical protein F1729_13405 [Gimesia maris]